MITKNLKITAIVISTGILLIGGVAYFVTKKSVIINSLTPNNKKIEIMSDDDKNALDLYHLGVYEVISRDAQGKPTEYRVLRINEEKPIALELMSDTEKVEKYLDTTTKIQVLQRDSKGKVIAYHIMKNDSDILAAY